MDDRGLRVPGVSRHLADEALAAHEDRAAAGRRHGERGGSADRARRVIEEDALEVLGLAKEGIRDRLWPGTFVSDSTLATVVAEIREALDDDAKQPRFLRTVHGVGYAFCGDARPDVPPPPRASAGPVSYRLLFDDREISLRPGENVLGRVDEGVLWIESAGVSRRHARIRVEDGKAVLEDLGSKNGTFLRGQRLSAPALLSDGDEIALGKVLLTFRILPVDLATRTDQG